MLLLTTLFHAMLLVANPSSAQVASDSTELHSDWQGTRTWVGPGFWANPMPRWRVVDGELRGVSGRGHTVHSLTHQIEATSGAVEQSVHVRLIERGGRPGSRSWAGFSIGIRGTLDGYQNALVHPQTSVDAGIRSDGKLVLADQLGDDSVSLNGPVRLTLFVSAAGQAVLKASTEDQSEFQVRANLPAGSWVGNIALSAGTNGRGSESTWGFRDWHAGGPGLAAHPDQTFGPILWSQYTLSDATLRLTAHFPPLGTADNWRARLQLQSDDGQWADAQESEIDKLSRTATFEIGAWDATRSRRYRIAYRWRGQDSHWQGEIRSDPRDQPQFRVAVFSCDHGELFPNRRIVDNVLHQNPDLVFFAGDQIYEGYGGFGAARSAGTEEAMLDYLRKYWQFGWSWRDVLKDRPSIIIPDDHDVFQGNLWGQGGRAVPGGGTDGAAFAKGGYIMPVPWVNAVQRTQVSHLPKPVDPEPCPSGIDVYFTTMRYGGASIAILEDRKFKTGPGSVFQGRRRGSDPSRYDLPGLELLGDRQEAFLKRWAQQSSAEYFRIVCSQTIFAKASTHSGQKLRRSQLDFDSGGWPQSARDRALQCLQPAGAVMLHGDQHFGMLLQHGVDQWEDSAVAFMVPGTSNGFPRAWWPEAPGQPVPPRDSESDDATERSANARSASARSSSALADTEAKRWTGRFFDDLGNRITVFAAGNPDRGSNELKPSEERSVEAIEHRKGSGHGLVTFDRPSNTVRFELYRLLFDAESPQPDDQFPGFPVTLDLPAPPESDQ
ncbi:alkaline phosphatase D family protein [Roseiconus nitratireducens]|uniref:alkaline phosphatase D family protein n=1 Tax=Roseiconus nitratireducens TaxID=2605748 RepID=UPI0013756385|nr:alkaline phosphatase D family protein [Roseiconus nitratireducens]